MSLSPEVVEALRKILATQAPADEATAELLHRCWVEIRENEEPPPEIPLADIGLEP